MDVVNVILLLGAAACFAAAAIGIATSRVNLLALGLFLWVLVPLIAALRA